MGDVLSVVKQQIDSILGSINHQQLQTVLLSVIQLRFYRKSTPIRQFTKLCDHLEKIQQMLRKQSQQGNNTLLRRIQWLQQQNNRQGSDCYKYKIVSSQLKRLKEQILHLAQENGTLKKQNKIYKQAYESTIKNLNQQRKKHQQQKVYKESKFAKQQQIVDTLFLEHQKLKQQWRKNSQQQKKRAFQQKQRMDAELRRMQVQIQKLNAQHQHKDIKIQKIQLANMNLRHSNNYLNYKLSRERQKCINLQIQNQALRHQKEINQKLRNQREQKYEYQIHLLEHMQYRDKAEIGYLKADKLRLQQKITQIQEQKNELLEKVEQKEQTTNLLQCEQTFIRKMLKKQQNNSSIRP